MLHRDWNFLQACRYSCTTKSAFASRAAATTYLNHSKFKGSVYHCPICGHWHITTKDRAYAKRLRRKLRRLLNDNPETRTTAIQFHENAHRYVWEPDGSVMAYSVTRICSWE